MKNLFLLTLLLASGSLLADCRPVLNTGSKSQKKLSAAIYGAYIFMAKATMEEEFIDLKNKVKKALSKELSSAELALSVSSVNLQSKFCDSRNIQKYAKSLAQEITVNPSILKPKLITPVEEKEFDLVKGMSPRFYKKRDLPVLNIGLVYYGSYYQESDLERVNALLEKRFNISTDQALKLNTVFKAIVPFKNNILNFPNFTQPNITDTERLQRLWYYDNVGGNILEEVYLQVKASQELKGNLAAIDALVIVTGAQFDALGFANGRIAVTENPMEIAWGLPDGGSVEYVTDERVVDELIHEIGHTLFLDHATTQCAELPYKEAKACCAVSPSRDDVMSYCRDRSKVDQNFFNKFEACNLKIIKEKIVPAMLSGGAWNIQGREKCI